MSVVLAALCSGVVGVFSILLSIIGIYYSFNTAFHSPFTPCRVAVADMLAHRPPAWAVYLERPSHMLYTQLHIYVYVCELWALVL